MIVSSRLTLESGTEPIESSGASAVGGGPAIVGGGEPGGEPGAFYTNMMYMLISVTL